MCFLWISEQTAIISLYNINWLVCITEIVCLLRGTNWVFIYISTFCPHSVFMCFVWISEQTVIISQYNINWLVCITETECVYCAVWTESLYVILRSAHRVYLCVFSWISEQTAIISLYNINWLVCITEIVCLLRGTNWVFIYNSTFCPHSVFMCFVWIWEQTAIISLYNINWLVLYNRNGVCLLRGADWVFMCNLDSFKSLNYTEWSFSVIFRHLESECQGIIQNGARLAHPSGTAASTKCLPIVALFQLENTSVWVRNPDSHPVKISAPNFQDSFRTVHHTHTHTHQ